MKPRRNVLAPGLDRWLREATAHERRTAIVRIGASTDPQRAARDLAGDGATVRSAGPSSVVCVVTPATLRRVAAEPWVLAVEEPRELFPRR